MRGNQHQYRRLYLALLGAALAASCGPGESDHFANAGVAHGNTDQARDAIVEWLVPAVTELRIRSEEEKAYGMEHGRALPKPEFLQPPLDAALKPFVAGLESSTTGSFIGGASDILPGLVNAWIAAFEAIYPNVDIEIGTPYAGSLGMLEVIEGNYDFVFVSRELKPTDVTGFEARYGYEPFSIPISGGAYRHYGFLDAIGFFVNANNPMNKITLAQIDAIFSSTRHRGLDEARTWGDLGLSGAWTDKLINAYGVEPWNGFEEFVRQRVLNFDGKRGEWRDDMDFSHTAFPIAEKVANDPLGIGYTGLAYIDHEVKVLPLVDQPGETTAATYENVANATYPLSRLIYFNANRSPANGLDPVLEEFLRYILSREGQQIVLDQGIYLPLRAWQVEAAREHLERK